jgi:hypothetical protein
MVAPVDVDISHNTDSIGVRMGRVELINLVQSSVEAFIGPNVAVPQVYR